MVIFSLPSHNQYGDVGECLPGGPGVCRRRTTRSGSGSGLVIGSCRTRSRGQPGECCRDDLNCQRMMGGDREAQKRREKAEEELMLVRIKVL